MPVILYLLISKKAVNAFLIKNGKEGVPAFISNHLSKCAHAFREALTKQTEVILVCNWLDLFYP